MKKGQFELFGVVLIVIILVLGMFFLIGNSLRQKKDLTQSFQDSELGQNMINTMLKTNLRACGGRTMTDIIIECNNGANNICSQPTEDPCDYVKKQVKDIFDVTLKEWNKKYRFRILRGGTTDLMGDDPDLKNDCGEFSEKEAPGIQPLPGSPPVIVQLEICK